MGGVPVFIFFLVLASDEQTKKIMRLHTQYLNRINVHLFVFYGGGGDFIKKIQVVSELYSFSLTDNRRTDGLTY